MDDDGEKPGIAESQLSCVRFEIVLQRYVNEFLHVGFIAHPVLRSKSAGLRGVFWIKLNSGISRKGTTHGCSLTQSAFFCSQLKLFKQLILMRKPPICFFSFGGELWDCHLFHVGFTRCFK